MSELQELSLRITKTPPAPGDVWSYGGRYGEVLMFISVTIIIPYQSHAHTHIYIYIHMLHIHVRVFNCCHH